MNDVGDGQRLGFRRVYGAEWRHLRWLAIASLLEEFGSQMVRCKAPECGHVFLRIRRQQDLLTKMLSEGTLHKVVPGASGDSKGKTSAGIPRTTRGPPMNPLSRGNQPTASSGEHL